MRVIDVWNKGQRMRSDNDRGRMNLGSTSSRQRAARPPYTLARQGGLRAALLGIFWWALTGGDRSSWWFGAAVVAVATVASLALSHAGPPVRARGLVSFISFFLWQSLRGGLDVAARALDPRLPLAPAFVTYRLRLPAGTARTLMIGIVGLLPGTLSADVTDDHLQVHALTAGPAIEESLQRLEEVIAGLFGLRLTRGIWVQGDGHE